MWEQRTELHTLTLNLVILSPKFIPNQNADKPRPERYGSRRGISIFPWQNHFLGGKNSTSGAWDER